MNKQFSLLLHSVLIVGALIPFSPIAPALQAQSSDQVTLPATSQESALVAFGSGVPGMRAGGGTR